MKNRKWQVGVISHSSVEHFSAEIHSTGARSWRTASSLIYVSGKALKWEKREKQKKRNNKAYVVFSCASFPAQKVGFFSFATTCKSDKYKNTRVKE